MPREGYVSVTLHNDVISVIDSLVDTGIPERKSRSGVVTKAVSLLSKKVNSDEKRRSTNNRGGRSKN